MLRSILNRLLGARSSRPRQLRRQRAQRNFLRFEPLEDRAMMAVTGLNITSLALTSGTDLDGGTALHVEVVEGSAAVLKADFSYSLSTDNTPKAAVDILDSSSNAVLSSGETTTGLASSIGGPYSANRSISLSTLPAGTYTARVHMVQPSAGSVIDSEVNSVIVDVAITVISSTTINNDVPSGAIYDGNTHGISGVTVSDTNGVISGASTTTEYFVDSDPTAGVTWVSMGATAPTNAGDYKVVSTFAGDTGHTGSSDTDYYSIAKANPTVVYSPATGGTLTHVYDGTQYTETATISGVAGTLTTFSKSATHVVDSGTTSGSYTDPSGNYNAVPYSVTVTITQATATVTPTSYTGTYDGNSHTASVVITGVGGPTDILNQGSVSRTNAGSDSVTVGLTGNPDYFDVAGITATVTINKVILTGDASTQDATNLAKNGAWVIDIKNIAGNVEDVVSVFNGMSFMLTIGANTYSWSGHATYVSATEVSFSLSLSGGTANALFNDLYALGVVDDGGHIATSAAKAVTDTIVISGTSINYSYSDDFFTRLFYSTK